MMDIHLIGGPLDGTSRRTDKHDGGGIDLTVFDDEGVSAVHRYRFLLPMSADAVLAVHQDLNNGQAMRLLWVAYVKVHSMGDGS